MFRVRRIYDDILPINRDAIAQVQEILRSQFPLLQEVEIAKLPEQLRNPMKYKYRSTLFVADDFKGRVSGFAFLLHVPDLNFCYLDFISTGKPSMGRGYGQALYERVREEASSLGAVGLFFECLPDDPRLCVNPEVCRQNALRLRFYERFGARPIIDTAYETPVTPGGDNPPYLVYDNLGSGRPLRRHTARAIVRSILELKYGKLLSADYVRSVVESFRDDPVRLREPRYIKKEEPPQAAKVPRPSDERIVLVVNEKHAIHHVKERGYVESPVRINAIMKELERTDLFLRAEPAVFSERHIASVHDIRYISFFKRVCAKLEPGKSIYPYVFPIRNAARPPRELPVRAGYYCIDTFTPLNRNAYLAAKRASDCALTAARKILGGQRLAYALVRPPGHHAERRAFGGFCYFNSAAVAAHYLSSLGKVAVLDIDYHHGNGTQDIFYERSDVLTISIHGHPNFAFPYFSGFRDEKGQGQGKGYNFNLPLPEKIEPGQYRTALKIALERIARFGPQFFVVALGLDTARGDPTGTWPLRAKDFLENGRLVGSLKLPTLVVQEGGYDTAAIGVNARNFFAGLWKGAFTVASHIAARPQEKKENDRKAQAPPPGSPAPPPSQPQ